MGTGTTNFVPAMTAGWQLLGLMCLIGCANWSNDSLNGQRSLLSTPIATPDSVIVETVLLRFPRESQTQLSAMWDVLDESILNIDARRRLDENGLRCGLIVGELPSVVRTRLEELAGNNPATPLEEIGLVADVTSDTHRLQCRAGRRKDLFIRSDLAESITVVYRYADKLRGETFDRPSLLFDLRAIPLGDGKAKFKFTPEIQFGETQHSISYSTTGIHNKFERKKHAFEDLTFETSLSPGETLICSSTDDAHSIGIGHAFFHTKTTQQTEEQVILMVRMIGSQLDELFAPEQEEAAKMAAERL